MTQSTYSRIDRLVNRKQLKKLDEALQELAKDLLIEGFETEDIVEYIGTYAERSLENAEVYFDGEKK